MKKSSKEIDEDYIDENVKNIKDEDIDRVFDNETAIKQKLKHLVKLKDRVFTLFQMLKDYRSKKYTETPWLSIAAIGFALLYVLNPLDLVPDFIPFVGYLDDASVLALTLKMVGNDVESYLLWKEKQDFINENEESETA